MELTEAQKDVKIAYLEKEKENNCLRMALLDYQIVDDDTNFKEGVGQRMAYIAMYKAGGATQGLVINKD